MASSINVSINSVRDFLTWKQCLFHWPMMVRRDQAFYNAQAATKKGDRGPANVSSPLCARSSNSWPRFRAFEVFKAASRGVGFIVTD